MRTVKFVCRRAKSAGFDDYKFPDPILEFAEMVSLPVHCLAFLNSFHLAPAATCFSSIALLELFQQTSKFREHMAWPLEQKKEEYFGNTSMRSSTSPLKQVVTTT
jgi:hypothetical protein